MLHREDTGQAALHIEWNHSSQQSGRPITLQSTASSTSGNADMRRIQDWLLSIEKIFEQVIMLQTIPNSDIFIHVTVFQAEGGKPLIYNICLKYL